MLSEGIFKSYDIRGIWGEEWDQEGVQRIALAMTRFFKPKTVAIGRDMRLSSEEIFSTMSRTLAELGIQVWDLGLISTDISYFISGKWRPDLTIMITASHNPPEYNGLKYTLPGGKSISFETGGEQIKELALSSRLPVSGQNGGEVIAKDPYPDYIKALLALIDLDKIKPFKIVVDAGNGMAGKVLPQVLQHLPVKVVPMYFELDGSFPNHLANPLLPEAVDGLKRRVLEDGADLGFGFDGDGDRMVMVDEKGELFSGSAMTAMMAEYFLKKNPGRAVCYNAVVGRIAPEVIRKNKGIPIRTPVGYSIIKATMRKKEAIFAGEHSYHFFFPKLYFADSGTAALLVCLQIISQSNRTASKVRQQFDIYPRSGEINFQVKDKEKMMELVERQFAKRAESVDHLDGVSIWHKSWWASIRASGTQPLLRLNVEADNEKILQEKTRQLVEFIEKHGGKRNYE
jgi:phosphomannomutase